jgi:hypothetical protein
MIASTLSDQVEGGRMSAKTKPSGERVSGVCAVCALVIVVSCTVLVFANPSLAAISVIYGSLLPILTMIFIGFFALSLVLTGLVLWLPVPAYVPVVVLSVAIALYQSSYYLTRGTWETGEICGQAGGLEIDCAYDRVGITLAILIALSCIPLAVFFLRASAGQGRGRRAHNPSTQL